MPALTATRMKKFLSRNNLISHLATIQKNGRPYINAVWYEFDGENIYLVLRSRSNHASNIKTNPKVAIYFDVIESPFTRVIVEGDASVLADKPLNLIPKAVEIGNRMATLYLGKDGPKYLVPTLSYPRALVKVKPIKWHGWEGVDWPEFMKK